MAIEFHQADGTQSQGYRVTGGSCDAPVSDAADDIILFISFFQNDGLTVTLNTPTLAGVSGDLIASSSRVTAYRFDGASIGTAQFTFSSNPASFRAFFVRVSGIKSSSPYSAGYSATPSGAPYSITAGTTAPKPGAAFVALIAPSGYPGGNNSFTVGFDSPDSIFDADEDWHNTGGIAGTITIIMALNVAVRYAENTGDVGFHSWTATFNFPTSVNTSIAGFWITPLQAPSAPIVRTPITNGKFTVGSTQTITYDSATDPNVDTEDLVYKIYYSDNNGLDYHLLTTTSPGILTYDWNTAGRAAGTYKIKVVANNGTDDGQPGYSGSFQLFADVAPGAPRNLVPSGYISQAARDFKWEGNYPDFDTQKAYELRYSSNADMSSPTSTGKVTSTAELKSWAASSGILASTGQKYWDVATYGVVDDTLGARSLPAPVNVAAVPATPTITSSSTANKGFWPITFTAIAHNDFRVRLVLSGDVRLNAIVPSSGFTFTTPFALANTEVWDVYVSVFDPQTGLESAEAHQTLTVSYTGTATPGLAVTMLPQLGAAQIEVANSDTIDHTRLYRSLNGGPYELISPRLPGDALYLDYNIANDLFDSYNQYSYKARSYKPVTFGFTDSAPSSGQGIQLEGLHLHVVDKTSTTANAGLKVNLVLDGPIIKRFVKSHKSVAMKGREKFITYAGQAKHTELTYSVFIPGTDSTTYAQLMAVYNANATLRIRDNDHNAIFGRFLEMPRRDDFAANRFTLSFTEEDFREVFTR